VAELAPPRRGEVNYENSMWTVYILRSEKDGKYYIGCTNNLKRRLSEHNAGYVSSTRSRNPLRLVHREEYKDQMSAFEREKKIKSYKGGNGLKKLLH